MPAPTMTGLTNAAFGQAIYSQLQAPKAVELTSDGAVPVSTANLKAAYRAAINAHAPAATPTDWFTILGSATKTIAITSIRIQARATAGNQYRVSLIKYSTAFTGGTSAAPTIVPMDSGFGAATAVVNTWAGGLPTPGTAVGKIVDESIPVAVLGTPAAGLFPCVYEFGKNSPPLILRGATQYLALNSNGVALPSGIVFDVVIEFTEESTSY